MEALLRSKEEEAENWMSTPPDAEQVTGKPCNCVEIELIFNADGIPSACVRKQLDQVEMQRERQRMCSRRGGIRGRASTQRHGNRRSNYIKMPM